MKTKYFPCDLTLVEMFNHSVSKFADDPAFKSFGVVITFKELEVASKQVAGWLQTKDIRKGDRVAIMSPNIAAYPALIFGIHMVGATVVNINPLYTPTELTFQVNDSGARFLFAFENFAHTVEAAVSNTNIEQVILLSPGDLLGIKGDVVNLVSKYVKKNVPEHSLPGSLTFHKVLQIGLGAGFTPVDVYPDDVAFLQYTGGTTGISKGATLLHKNVSSNINQIWDWLRSEVEPKGPHTMVAALPLYHIFGLTACCLLMIKIGGCSILIPNPRDLNDLTKILRKSKFTIFSGVNTLYSALTDHSGFRKLNFNNLSFCVSGGMATQQIVAQKWKKLTGKPIIEGYGLSETSPVLTLNRPDIEEFSGTIGFPLSGTQIKLDEHGEILVKGPQVMSGYWNRSDETEKVMTEDGFFRTGDVAIREEDGSFRIVDRLKDVIIVSGFNVYPNEIEDVFSRHPKVKEVAVVGIPCKSSGETPVAFIVPYDDTLTVEELRKFAKESLTPYKVPKTIIFRELLPKTNVGKILRRTLKEEYLQERLT